MKSTNKQAAFALSVFAVWCFAILALGALPACKSRPQPVPNYTKTTPTAEWAFLSRISASVKQAIEDLRGIGDSAAKQKVDTHLHIAEYGLDTRGVIVTEKDAKDARFLSSLFDLNTPEAAAQISELTMFIKNDTASQIKRANEQRDEAQKAIKQMQLDYEQKLEKQKNDMWAWIKKVGTIVLFSLSGIFLLIAAVRAWSAFTTGVGAANSAKQIVGFGLLAAGCFGLAYLINQDWFLWALLAVTAGGVAYFCYLAYREPKAKAGEKIAITTIKGMDEAYDQAIELGKDAVTQIDSTAFASIENAYNSMKNQTEAKGLRAYVHSIRANIAKNKAAKETSQPSS